MLLFKFFKFEFSQQAENYTQIIANMNKFI